MPTRGYSFIADVEIVFEERTGGRSSAAYVAAAALLVVLTIGLDIWIVSGREPPPTITSTWRPSQITTSPALDIYPALSSDGTTLAYSSDRGGGFAIYVKQLAPGGDELQLTRGGDHNLQPAWSPDGTHIAYYSKARGGIWVVPAFGGVSRQLPDFGSLPVWSPEGEEIAFQSYPLTDIGLESPPARVRVLS